jgi:hypothetical protein
MVNVFGVDLVDRVQAMQEQSISAALSGLPEACHLR